MSTVIDINLSNLKKKVNQTSKKDITLKVGFLNAESAKKAQKNEYGGKYMVSPEYHKRALTKKVILSPTIEIIPRPFMHTTIEKNKNKWMTGIKKLLKTEPIIQALSKLGEKMVGDIQDTIINNDFKRNPPKIAQIKDGRDKPLVDSGDMLRDVAYEIVE